MEFVEIRRAYMLAPEVDKWGKMVGSLSEAKNETNDRRETFINKKILT